MDLISIVLPVYNGEKFLAQSISSILSQSYRQIELVIVDDCSSDATPEIIQYFADRDNRIKFIRNPANYKLPKSLNIGFSLANGKYLTWTSDDNCYDEDAIEKLYHFLQTHPELALVYADMQYIDEMNFVIGANSSHKDGIYLYNNIGACFLYKRECLDQLGGYDEDYILVEDYEYWLRISRHFKIGHIKEPLYRYRYHSQSLSSTRVKEISHQLLKLKLNYLEFLLTQLNAESKPALYFELNLYDAKTARKKLPAFHPFINAEEPIYNRSPHFDPNKPSIIFGAGSTGINTLKFLGPDKVSAFIDNNPAKLHHFIRTKEILSLQEVKQALSHHNLIIGTDVRNSYHIAKQLEAEKIADYIIYHELITGEYCT